MIVNHGHDWELNAADSQASAPQDWITSGGTISAHLGFLPPTPNAWPLPGYSHASALDNETDYVHVQGKGYGLSGAVKGALDRMEKGPTLRTHLGAGGATVTVGPSESELAYTSREPYSPWPYQNMKNMYRHCRPCSTRSMVGQSEVTGGPTGGVTKSRKAKNRQRRNEAKANGTDSDSRAFGLDSDTMTATATAMTTTEDLDEARNPAATMSSSRVTANNAIDTDVLSKELTQTCDRLRKLFAAGKTLAEQVEALPSLEARQELATKVRKRIAGLSEACASARQLDATVEDLDADETSAVCSSCPRGKRDYYWSPAYSMHEDEDADDNHSMCLLNEIVRGEAMVARLQRTQYEFATWNQWADKLTGAIIEPTSGGRFKTALEAYNATSNPSEDILAELRTPAEAVKEHHAGVLDVQAQMRAFDPALTMPSRICELAKDRHCLTQCMRRRPTCTTTAGRFMVDLQAAYNDACAILTELDAGVDVDADADANADTDGGTVVTEDGEASTAA